MKRFRNAVLILFCAALLSASASFAQFQQTIVVTPVPNDTVSSGQALLSAMAATSNASWGRRYLVKIEPGVYDLGTTPLALRPHVDVEGSGRDRTFIWGTGMDANEVAQVGLTRGTILGANKAELRDVTVQASGQSVAIAIYNGSSSPTLRNVKVVAKQAESCWGVRNVGASTKIDGLEARVNCTFFNSGISSLGGSRPRIEHVQLTSWGASSETNNVGLSIETNSYPVLLYDVEIDAGAGAPGAGIDFPDNSLSSTGILELIDVRIETHGGVGISGGEAGFPVDLVVRDSAIRGGRIGVDVHGDVTIEGSLVEGTEATVLVLGSSRVATTRLDGGGSLISTCAGVYDESFIFFPATCP